MGGLTWEEVESFFRPDNGKTKGWEFIPLVQIGDLKEMKRRTETPVPSDFFEVLLFRALDLFSLRTETTLMGQQVRAGLNAHMSIIPSFQMRESLQLKLDGTKDGIAHLFSSLTEITKDLGTKAGALGLTPTMTISRVQLQRSSRRGEVETALKDGIKAYIETNPTITKSASILGSTIAIKFLEGQFEHFVIFDFGTDSGLTVDYLYLHMIGKLAVRGLQHQIAQGLERTIEFDNESVKFHNLEMVTSSVVRNVSEFRWRVLRETREFRKTHDRSDLALTFMDFHSNRRFGALEEAQFVPDVAPLLKSEIQDTNMFYVQPLNSLVQRTEQVLTQVQGSVSSLLEVFTAMVNLRSQKLIERLQFVSIGVAVVAIIIALLPWLIPGAHL
jgi:hypothetical protein